MCHLFAVGISFFFILLAELKADTGGIFSFVMIKKQFLNEANFYAEKQNRNTCE